MIVIGVGNAARGDDAAGLRAAAALRERVPAGVVVREHEGETLALLDGWEGAAAVILVDAVRSGATPGMLHRLDASSTPLPETLTSSSSTHALSLAETIELARALGRLPATVIVHGVEGRRYDAGAGLSPEVAAAIEPLVAAVERDLEAVSRPRS